MSSKKTRKSVKPDVNLRNDCFKSSQYVIEEILRRLENNINSTFVTATFVNKQYIRGLKNANNSKETETEQFINLQRAQITLVIDVMIYLARILITFFRLHTYLPEKFEYTEEELDYMIEKLENFLMLTNIHFFNSLPNNMKPESLQGITNVLEAQFNIDGFVIQNVTETEISELDIYKGHSLFSIIENLTNEFVLKRVELMDIQEKKEKERVEAEKRAAQAEAELLELIKKPSKTQKNKPKPQPPAHAIPNPPPPTISKKPLSEKELKKIEADEKNRQKQLLEKQQKLEQEQKRNEELQKKFNALMSQPAEKPVSPPLPKPVSPPAEKPLSSPLPKPVSPPLPKPVSPPLPKPVSPPAEKPIEQYFNQTQFDTIKANVRSNSASHEIETEFPNMQFSTAADETYKYIVRSTMYILSEITKATGFPIFCLKGGKVLQLATQHPYISDDIDILVLNGSHKTALELAKIIKKMFVGYPISVLDKSQATSENAASTANQNIIKMSYGTMSLKAFLDIDFSPTPTYATQFFSNLQPIRFGSLLFFAQSLLQFIDEKIFFYELYRIKCAETTDHTKQNICKYQQSKFQKILMPLIIQNNVSYKERLTQLQPMILSSLQYFNIA